MADPQISMSLVWTVWAVSLVLVVVLTIVGLQRIRWSLLRQLAFDETGAAYTLSYVMVVPMYILFMCLVVETTLLILAKLGADYAAFAAVRSAIVHFSDGEANTAERWAERAARNAFVPFANGFLTLPSGSTTDNEMNRYLAAYRKHSSKPASERYLKRKYQFAHKYVLLKPLRVEPLTDSQFEEDEKVWLANISVDIECRFAFHLPAIGRLMGGTWDPDGKFVYSTIHSTATLQSEAPKNAAQKLGINYEPWRDEQF